jgi:hypothetical protein
MAEEWIQKMKEGSNFKAGSFSKQAKRAGKSTAAFASEVLKPGSKATTTTKRRARLAQTFGKLRRRQA